MNVAEVASVAAEALKKTGVAKEISQEDIKTALDHQIIEWLTMYDIKEQFLREFLSDLVQTKKNC